jgi:hypothetical protein
MPDVVLSNDDLTVLSGPSIIELLVDIGPTGTRGSKVFVGVGNPNSIEIGQTPILNDLYINSAPGADYGYLYQYLAQPGGNLWVEVLSINPTIYSAFHLTTFLAGTSAYASSGSIVIPIADISSAAGLTANNFNVQYSIQNSKPVASSISLIEVDGDDLIITIELSEFDGTWSPLEDDISVNVFISVVI